MADQSQKQSCTEDVDDDKCIEAVKDFEQRGGRFEFDLIPGEDRRVRRFGLRRRVFQARLQVANPLFPSGDWAVPLRKHLFVPLIAY